MRLHRVSTVLAGLVLALSAGPLAADTIITGSVGRAFSGDLQSGHTSYGAAIGFMGEGVFGLEVEGTYTPHFFGDTPAGSSNVTTLMGNLILGAPMGQTVRVYATGGVGLMKFRVPDVDQFFDVNRNDFGMNAGAGVMIHFGGGALGARGDVRYFRNLKQSDTSDIAVDLGGFHYWRGSVGVTLKF